MRAMAVDRPARVQVIDRPLAGLLALYLALAGSFSVLNPLFESPDEVYHAGYVRYLQRERRLPELAGEERAEYHQAPLYYLLSALVVAGVPMDDYPELAARTNPFQSYRFWEAGQDNKNVYLHGPWDAWPYERTSLAVHLVRAFSVLLGLGTVAATYQLARQAFGWDSWTALAGAAFVAFNPVFIQLSSSVSNDALTPLIGALLLLQAVQYAQVGATPRRAVWLGVLLGLDWLAKVSTLFITPAVVLALLLGARQAPSGQRLARLLRHGALVLAIAFALAGWMFVRNIALYGEPLAVRRNFEVWNSDWTSVAAWRALGPELPFMWTTFWGRFGHGQVALPEWAFTVLGLACLPAVLGVLVALGRRRPGARTGAWWILLAAAVGLVLAMFSYYLNSPDGHAARYTFPAISAIACLLAAGWVELTRRQARLAAGALAGGLAALAVWSVFFIVPQAYAPPLLATLPPGQAQPATRFGDVAEVLALSAAPEAEPLRPGGTLAVTLTWHALARPLRDYAIYIHLVDEAGVIVAQRDSYPGLGRYPSTAWAPGAVWVDTYRVLLPESAYAPNQLTVNFGLYDYASGERLPVVAVAPKAPPQGQTAYVVEPPAGAEWPNAVAVNFDGKLLLKGYTLTPRVARPGETLALTLYWSALSAPLEPYTVFAHVVGPGDRLYANGDGVPVLGLAPTPLWQPGAVISDTHSLLLADDTPPGQYDVEIGWYHSETIERLLILEPNGVRVHNRWLLSPVRVVE